MSASKWDGMPALAFDTETSGVDVFADRILTAALVDVPYAGRPTTTTYVTDPGVNIPEAASAVNGLTREHLAANATHDPDQMLFEIAGRLALALGHGVPIVGMNLAFDLTLFEVECHRHGVAGLRERLGGPSKISPIIDVLVLDKYADTYRKGGRKLVDLCRVYDVRHTGAHDATADALACARIWPKLMAAHPDKFKGFALPGLHVAQVGWRKKQQESFAAYAAKNPGKYDGEFDAGWPLHSQLAERLAGVERIGVTAS